MQFEPPHLFKVKNGALRILDSWKHTHGGHKSLTNTELHSGISLTQKQVDIATVTLACERLEEDGMVKLLIITENNSSYKSYFVKITTKGQVFIRHGGYTDSSSFFQKIKNHIKQNIIVIILGTILAILSGLVVAYFTNFFNWN